MNQNPQPDPNDFQVLRSIAKSCDTTSWGLGQHLEAEGLRTTGTEHQPRKQKKPVGPCRTGLTMEESAGNGTEKRCWTW